jgi:hypothetical protein
MRAQAVKGKICNRPITPTCCRAREYFNSFQKALHQAHVNPKRPVMTLAPDLNELLARARADLRMGVPVVVQNGPQAALVLAAETLDAQRLADLRALGQQPVLAISARRAQTLKARAYDVILRASSCPPMPACHGFWGWPIPPTI